MEASEKGKELEARRRALARRADVWPMVAIVLSFIVMGGLRVMATPLADNQGAFPDEVFHFVRSVSRARVLAQNFGLPSPRFSASELSAIGTRGSDLCSLGMAGTPECEHSTEGLPAGSGEIRGSGVYLLHGLAQLLLPVSDTHSRLLLGRVWALGVGMALAWVLYHLGFLLFADRKIAVAVAALVVLLPSVNGIMAAVSTEGPALLAVALLLWAAVVIYLRGYSFGRLFGLCLGALACVFTKITALVVFPVVVMLLMHKAGFRWRTLLGVVLVGSAVLIVGIWMTPSVENPRLAGAAHWYVARAPAMVPIYGRSAELAKLVDEKLLSLVGLNELTNLVDVDLLKKSVGFGSMDNWVNVNELVSRIEELGNPNIEYIKLAEQLRAGINKDRGLAPVGLSAFAAIDNSQSQHSVDTEYVQFLPAKVSRGLARKRLSVGAWMQAPARILVHAPEVILAFSNGRQLSLPGSVFVASGDWQFVAYEVQLPDYVPELGVRLQNEGFRLLWDGVILATGSYAAFGQEPAYDDASANTGTWGGTRFENLLKNGSGEDIWKGASSGLKTFVHRFGTGTLANRLDGQLYSLYDFERTSAGYLAGLRAIFATFWGSFVGGDWPGLARWHNGVAAGVLVLAALGWLRLIWRRGLIPEVMSASVAFAFLLAAMLYLLVGVVRMEVSAEWVPPLFYATARYVLPAIIPVVALTVGGLAQLLSKRVTRAMLALLIVGTFLANTWMLLRVELPYFSCPLEIRWACTAL